MRKLFFIIILLFPIFSIAQKKTIKGKVSDSQTKEALIAATVRIGNDGLGTITNADGYFTADLPKGKHKLVFSYIGYKTDTLIIDTNKDSLIAEFLVPGEITLPEITVNANEDPAISIIRAAIKNKKENKKGLISFEYDAYNKRIMKSDGKLASVEESFVKGFKETGKPLKEFVQSVKKTENMKKNMSAPTSIEFTDFTENRLEMNSTKIPLPLADDAFDFYDYKLIKTIETGTESVYKILVIPKSRLSALMEGNISINVSDYTLIGVDLKNNEGFTFPFIDDLVLKYKQIYSNYSGYWIPQNTEFSFSGVINIGGLISLDKLEMNQTYLINRCTVNSTIPESVRNAKKSVYGGFTTDSTAIAIKPKRKEKTKRKPDLSRIRVTPSKAPDSLSVSEIEKLRSIPLSSEEVTAYKELDSTKTIDKIIKVKGPMAALATVSDGSDTLKNKKKSFLSKTTDALFNYGNFRNNRVEGIYLGAYADFDSMEYEYYSTIEAGFSIGMKQMEGKVGFGYNLGEDHLDRIDANIFRTVNQWNQNSVHPTLVNTIFYSLEGDDNFNYTINSGWNVGFHKYFTDSLYYKIYYVSETKQNAALSVPFSIFNRKMPIRPNPSINEGNDRRLNFTFGWGMDPFSFEGKFASNPDEQNGILVNIDFSHPNLGSDYDYKKIFISGQYRINTIIKQQFLGPYLIAKMDAGISTGKQEIFNLFSPDASMKYYAPFGTMRALNPYQMAGNKMISLQLEHNWRAVPFSAIYLNFVRDWQIDFITGFNMVKIWNDTTYFPGQDLSKPYWETNIGISRIAAFLRLDAVYNSNDQWSLRFSLASLL